MRNRKRLDKNGLAGDLEATQAVGKGNGLGMPAYDKPGTFGDLYVEILVEIPSKLSAEEPEGYERLAAIKP